MRCARLKEDWLLRGWTDEPRTVLNWKTSECRRLTEPLWRAASACDGQTDFDYIPGVMEQNIMLNKLIAAGIAEDCPPGDAVMPYQGYRLADNPYLRSVHWSVTGRCNLKCRHCYMESPDGRYGELPWADMLTIANQLAEANVHQVELTGGEPFLRRDLLALMAELAARQINVTQIYSNGVLITDEALAGIRALGLSPRFQISFDGCGTHDAMRGISGTEAVTVEAIRRLRRHDFRVAVATCIDRTNIAALDATYELMKDLSVVHWRVGTPHQAGNWRQSDTAMTWEEVLPFCAAIATRWRRDGRPFFLQMTGFNSAEEDELLPKYHPDDYDCLTCRLDMSLLPDGTAIPCPSYTDTAVRDRMPNLLRLPLNRVWSASALRSIIDIRKRHVLDRNSGCAQCEEFRYCGGGCRAASVAATGDLLAVDPQICDIFKSRYGQRFREQVRTRTSAGD